MHAMRAYYQTRIVPDLSAMSGSCASYEGNLSPCGYKFYFYLCFFDYMVYKNVRALSNCTKDMIDRVISRYRKSFFLVLFFVLPITRSNPVLENFLLPDGHEIFVGSVNVFLYMDVVKFACRGDRYRIVHLISA